MKQAKRSVGVAGAVMTVLLLLVLMLSAGPAGAEDGAPGRMTGVALSSDGKTLTVTAEIGGETGKGPFCLFALAPGEEPGGTDPVAELAPTESPSVSVPCAGNDLNLLFRGYLFALREEDGSYTALTDRMYVSDPAAAAKPSSAPNPASKKGLSVSEPFDADLLGAAHTVLPVRLNLLLSAANVTNTVSFSFSGKTFTVNGSYLEWIDAQVRVLSGNGVRVYLRLVLGCPDGDDLLSRALLFPGVTGEEARFLGISVANAGALDTVAGTVRFLARRYSGEDPGQGTVADYIVGYEVNSNRYCHYSGPMDIAAYAAGYADCLRAVSTAVRSVISDGAVYVPIANNWNEPSPDPAIPADPLLDYPARAFLNALNAVAVPYHIALDAYASDVTQGEVWNDEKAVDSPDTPFVTMKNIGILLDETDRMPAVRNGLLISEFGVSGKPGSAEEDTQTAAFLYAYGKAVADSRITALVWHRQTDNSGEKGLYFGLRAASVTDPERPGDKKKLYNVFRDIDTPDCPELSAWLSLLPEGNEYAFPVCRRVMTEVAADPSSTANLPSALLFDPGDRFFPAENAKWVAQKIDGTVSCALYPAWDYSCVRSGSLTKDAFGNAQYLSVTLSAALPGKADDGAPFLLILTGTDKNGLPLRLECAARLADGTETTLFFRIDGFLAGAETVSSLKLCLRAPEGSRPDDLFQLDVRSVGLLSERSPAAGRLIRVLLVLAVITAVGLVIFLVLWTFRRRALKRKKQLTVDN